MAHHKPSHKLCKPRCKLNSSNETWFDYTILDISRSASSDSSTEPRKTKGFKPGNLKKQETVRNSSHQVTVGRFEMFAKSKQICDRLKRVASLREEQLMACLEDTKVKTILEVRRRCFCESVGRKFCALCRHKLNKEISHELPGILVNRRGLKSDKVMAEDQFLQDPTKTPDPSLPMLLKQASEAVSTNALDLSQDWRSQTSVSTTDGDSYLSSHSCVVPEIPSLIYSSSTSSSVIPKGLNTSDDNEQDDQNNHCLSPVVPKLPNICNFSAATAGEEDVDHVNRQITRNETITDEAMVPSHQLSGNSRQQVSSDRQSSINTNQFSPALPWYSYPVQPVLMDMKYINFSIYDKIFP